MANLIVIGVSVALSALWGVAVYQLLKRCIRRRKPVPPGSYKTVVETAVEENGKVRLSLRIVDGPHKGRKLYG
jgi:hypothetical protein